MDLSFLPNGSMLNRWLLGWMWSFIIAMALVRHIELTMESWWGLVTFSAVLVTLCRLLLLDTVKPADHTGIACTSTLSIVAK